MSLLQESAANDPEYDDQLSLLKHMEGTSTYWTGTSERYNVEEERLPQEVQRIVSDTSNQRLLGIGQHGEVREVILGKIPMAMKLMRPGPGQTLSTLVSEIEAIRKLESHPHIIKLVGSYVTPRYGGILGMLTFPVADCDLHRFLDSLEAATGVAEQITTNDAPLQPSNLLQVAGLTSTRIDESFNADVHERLGLFLKKSMGCMAEALEWIHLNKIAHGDLKPQNILLRHGKILITDFGISRDRTNAEATYTDTSLGHTKGYAAPETEDQGTNSPFRADIYSLGCIYMHLFSVISGEKTRKECKDTLLSHPKDREQLIIEYLRPFSSPPPQLFDRAPSVTQHLPRDAWPYSKLVNLIASMLLNDRHARPTILQTNEILHEIGGEWRVFHGQCCHIAPAESSGLHHSFKDERGASSQSGFQSSVHDRYRADTSDYDKGMLSRLDSRRGPDMSTLPRGYGRTAISRSPNEPANSSRSS